VNADGVRVGPMPVLVQQPDPLDIYVLTDADYDARRSPHQTRQTSQTQQTVSTTETARDSIPH